MHSIWRYLLGVLALVAATVWLAVLVYPEYKLYLIACDVGQGDAILATYRTSQVLIDGGPDNSVLGCLSNNLPFWDREIEIVVLTHPQKDHFEGLIEVFRQYDVQVLLATPLDSSSQSYEVLKKAVGGGGVKVINPTSGMVIRSGLMQLEILHPSEQFLVQNSMYNSSRLSAKVLGTRTTEEDPNDFSIVAILRFGEFDALLTGDIGPDISDRVAQQLALSERSESKGTIEYIKIPHHGSKNGISSGLLVVSDPEIAVISVGRNNQYGHPHQEVLKMLSERDIKTLRTDLNGDIEIVTDGEEWLVVE